MIRDTHSGLRVTLSPNEEMLANFVAKFRQDDNQGKGYKNTYGLEAGYQKGLEIHELGAQAEMAAAKGLGVYWTGAVDRGEQDIAGYEVRATAHHAGRLFLHPKDPRDTWFVLVRRLAPREFLIPGMAFSSKVMNDQHWKDPRPGKSGRECFVVENHELLPA